MSDHEQKVYGQFSSSMTQRPTALGPTKIVLDTCQDASGEDLSVDFVRGDIIEVILDSSTMERISSLLVYKLASCQVISPVGLIFGLK